MSSNGRVYLSQIVAEFGPSFNRTSAFYGIASGVPTTGSVGMSKLLGKRATVPAFSNTPPVQVSDSLNAAVNSAPVSTRSIAGASDAFGHPLTFSIVSAPSNLTVNLVSASDGSVTYSAPSDAVVSGNIVIRAVNRFGRSNTVSIPVDIGKRPDVLFPLSTLTGLSNVTRNVNMVPFFTNAPTSFVVTNNPRGNVSVSGTNLVVTPNYRGETYDITCRGSNLYGISTGSTTLRITELSETPITAPFKIVSNSGKTWKYDQATNTVRLNTGVEMEFVVEDDPTVFNYNENATRRRFALKTQTGLYVLRNNSTFTTGPFVANNANFAFRIVTFDNGASYRIFNDTYTGWNGDPYNFDGYHNYPYVQTWLAYNPSTDEVVPVNWRDTSLSTSWSIENIAAVPPSAIDVANPVSHFAVSYPVRMFSSDSLTISDVLYGTGTHTISFSSQLSTRQAFKVFNGSSGSLDLSWQAGGQNVGPGQWMQISFPYSVKLKAYMMDCNTGTIAARCPGSWTISCFPPDSSTPVTVHQVTRGFMTGINWWTPWNTDTFCNVIRFTINSFYIGQSLVSVPELRFFCTTV